ncbi:MULTISPECIES: hypothetical protein [Bacillus]|nr:hypothetical protein [Bacillus nitratireducens]UNP79032.1 hypothetical protein MN033_03540 [Bacillus nitratireducens]
MKGYLDCRCWWYEVK